MNRISDGSDDGPPQLIRPQECYVSFYVRVSKLLPGDEQEQIIYNTRTGLSKAGESAFWDRHDRNTVFENKESCVPDFISQKFRMNRYCLSYFIAILQRKAYLDQLLMNQAKVARIVLTTTDYCDSFRLVNFYFDVELVDDGKHPLDKTGNTLACKLLHEKIEMDDTLAWLSSLGGAFSALGDLSASWAEQAGRITLHQFQIAKRLQDPLLVSRCHLWAALCLIQRGCLKSAKKIILNEFNYALSLPVGRDSKLINMCRGIWSKLKYVYSLQSSVKPLQL